MKTEVTINIDDTLITSFGNFVFTNIGKIFFSLKVTDILYTFVLGKSSKFKNLQLKKKDFCICPEIPINIARSGHTYTNNKSNERKRLKGKKKVNAFYDGLKILIYMISRFFK